MEYTFTGQMSYMDDPITSETPEGFGLMFYNARWYDPAIGRFTQADSIIPPGVQGYDRYAYVNNNPLRYIDLSGHCPMCVTVAIGAAIGGVVNAGLYIWSETQQSDGFNISDDLGDLAVAAVQGVVVGGLIGSGVGAGEGLAMAAGLGAASNLVGDQVSNLVTGDDYNPATTSIDTGMGIVTGIATMGQSGPAANAIAGGIGLVEYGLDSWATHEQVTLLGGVGHFASGFIGQAWSEGSKASFMEPIYEDFGTGVMRMTSKGSSALEAEILSNTITPAFQGFVEEFGNRIYQQVR
jgi:RHS repeat-associated protein